MRIGHRQRVALAIAVLGTAIGAAPLQTAVADGTGTSGTNVELSTPETIYVNGTPGAVDYTITAPPTTDTYVRLEFTGAGLDHLRVTDDTGAAVPSHGDPSDGSVKLFDIGAADSDHNGVPGRPMVEGTTRIHVAADYGVGRAIGMDAHLVDGASGRVLGNADGVGWIGVPLSEPSLSSSWTSPGHGSGSGSAMVISTGYPEPAHMQLNTRMGATTSPPATTHTRLSIASQQPHSTHYTTSQLVGGVTVEYSTDDVHYERIPWKIDANGSAVLDFPTLAWGSDKPIEATEHLRISAAWAFSATGSLNGVFSTLAADGRQVQQQEQEFAFPRDYVPAYARHSFYGRDAGGVLWQYREGANPDVTGQYYTPRTRVGAGWQTYDLLTKLSTFGVEGNGDLVGRDRAGVLWYYRGSGNGDAPFVSRVKVGGGWQVYDTLVGGGDLTGDGKPDLLARDRGGVLWLYKGTGNPADPFAARTRIGGGWNTYNLITGGADVTGDGRPDLLARDHDGVLWLYKGTGNPADPFAIRTKVGGGWNTYTSLVSPGSLDGRDEGSLLARDHDGRLWIYFGKSGFPFQPRVQIGTGWNTYDTMI